MIFNLNGEWPRIGMVCLEEDNMPSGASGQASEPSVEEVSAVMSAADSAPAETSEAAPAESYYHSLTIPGEEGADDEVLNFKDPKELSDSYMRNRFRRSDYTKKTQALADQRKDFEKQQAALLEKETMLARTSNQFNEYDSLLKTLTPQQFNEFVNQVKGVTKEKNPEVEALKERLDAMTEKEKAAERKQALSKKKEAQLGRFESSGKYLKSQYGNYDHDSVMESWNKLNDVQPEMAEQAVLEMLYFANMGRGSSAPAGDPSGPPRTRVAGKSASTPDKPMSIREAKAAALADLG